VLIFYVSQFKQHITMTNLIFLT